MDIRNKILKDGYIVLKNFFKKEELEECKQEILNYTKKNKTIGTGIGITIPDFVKINELKKTGDLKNRFKKILNEYFQNDNYRFCHHNDIGIDRIVSWHKDQLNGKYRNLYEKTNIWDNKAIKNYKILKVLIYLEDHSNNDNGLKLIPGTHLIKEKKDFDKHIQLKPSLGDVIIFDQRITHRGCEKKVLNKMDRILVSFGFGYNNIYTDEFERGTIERQNEQNRNRKRDFYL